MTDDGATLTLAGPADAPADDPGGYTIAFPAKHPSLDLVKRMKAGSQVRLTGRVDTVTKSAFTVKDALVKSATGVTPPQIAGGPKPFRGRPGCQPEPSRGPHR